MTFHRADPNTHYRAWRVVSEWWELGMSPYARGMRLRMGPVGRPPSVLDFCMGADSGLFFPIACAVLQRLESVADSATAEEIDAVFPWTGSRPDLVVHLGELLGTSTGQVTEL